MTDEELAALCEKATPGPWEINQTVVHGRVYGTIGVRCDELRLISGSGGAKSYTHEVCAALRADADEVDMRFIAAARTAIPALLSRLEAMRAERDSAREALQAMCDYWSDWFYASDDGCELESSFNVKEKVRAALNKPGA